MQAETVLPQLNLIKQNFKIKLPHQSGSFLLVLTMRVQKLFFLLIIISSGLFAQQNLNENFTPLKSVGTLPEIFTQNVRNIIKTEITELNKGKEKDKALKTVYLAEANYEIEKIVLVSKSAVRFMNRVSVFA